MRKKDYAESKTDEMLEALESKISKVYGQATRDMQKTVDNYFKQFEKRDAEMRTKLENGEITKEYYTQWRLAQIGRGERYEKMRDEYAERMTDANEVATAYINDSTPSIYSLNRNYSAYTIEQVAGDVGFTLYDEQTVKRLIVQEPDLMPFYPPEKAIKRGIDLDYGKKQITKNITSSIMQGLPLKKVADNLQRDIPTMNRNSAIRSARTATTGAQNAGRIDGYTAAEKMGIKLKKEWLATLDKRTRHSHARLDGVQVENSKKFDNGCMFPGDPNGPASELYNCRCCLVAALDDVDTSDAKRRARDPETGENVLISDMSYSEWAGWKEQTPKEIPQAKKISKFVPAKTIEEAEEYARQHIFSGEYLGKVAYKGIDVEIANGINKALEEVTEKYGKQLAGIEVVNPKTAKGLKALGGNADAPFATASLTGKVYINKDIVKNAKTLKAYNDKGEKDFKFVMLNKDKLSGKMRSLAETYEKAGKSIVDDSIEGMITHEYGHFLAVEINPSKETVAKISEKMGEYVISGYSQHSASEYFAECFTEYERGDRSKLDPTIIELFEGAIKR